MKLLTLNTHSLVEDDYERKLRDFIAMVLAEKPDVIALQEVNQTMDAPEADASLMTGYVPAQEEIPLRTDNHAARAAAMLREAGVDCSWTWLPVKVGYGRYDEGLAMLSLIGDITHTESFLLSRADDYANWKTRKVLGVQVAGLTDWFYNVHMGWWEDEEEPFIVQWKILNLFLHTKPRYAPVWLMGDFNAPAEKRGEGYDCIEDAGWYDTYLRAQEKSGAATLPGDADGWRGGAAEAACRGMRIDQVWCSMPVAIVASRVLFDGAAYPAVSDHYGVLVETLPGDPCCQEHVAWDDLIPDPAFDEA